ncbi:MAG: RDD family protein [Chloroflexota bacterium]|nr:RDD family protein [Chloroflexota bacterium]
MQDLHDEQTHFPFYPRKHLKYDIPPGTRPKITGPLSLRELASYATFQALPRASAFQRCCSYVFDVIALGCLFGNPCSLFLFYVIAFSVDPTGPAQNEFPPPGPKGSIVLWLCIVLACMVYYLFTLARGKTVGYAVTGITAVRVTGTRPAGRALLPALIKTAGTFLWPFLFLYLFTPMGQAEMYWLLPTGILLFLGACWLMFARRPQAWYEKISGVILLNTRHHAW